MPDERGIPEKGARRKGRKKRPKDADREDRIRRGKKILRRLEAPFANTTRAGAVIKKDCSFLNQPRR